MDRATESLRAELARLVETIRQGDHGAAVSGLKRLLETHPDHEVATGLLAATYFQLGMREEARSLYERLLAAHPHNALARFQLGMLRLSDDPRAALALWTPLLDGDAEFMAHFHCALAHIQLQEPESAAPLLDHAATHMPVGHPLREQLERLRGALGRSARGVEYRP